MERPFLISFLEFDVGVLEFLQTEPDPFVALVLHPLEAESEGHHYKLVVISLLILAPGKLLVFAMFTFDSKRRLTTM